MDERKKRLLVPASSTVREVMTVLNDVPYGIVLLVDGTKKLEGIVTDGDIRRALLKGTLMEDTINSIMNRNAVTLKGNYNKRHALGLFSEGIRSIPVVSDEGRIMDILIYREFTDSKPSNSLVVVRAKAPLRVTFAGGGTDTNAFIVKEGGVALNATINRYCLGTLIKRDDERIIIESKDYDMRVDLDDITAIEYDGRLDLVKAVISLMKPDFGFELFLQSDVVPGTGLGGSATVASVIAGIFNYMREEKLDHYELAELAFQAERIEIGIQGGWQDQYAAVFGGINFIEFNKDDVIVHPLRIRDEILYELEASLLLCYTGQARNSGEIHKKQTEAYKSNNKRVKEALDQTKGYAVKMKNALLRGDLVQIGEALHEAWLVKKRFDENVSNNSIDKIYEIGKKAGATGGKVLGAGGGGYILFFCPPLKKPDVVNELMSVDGQVLDVEFEHKGLRTWCVHEFNG